jgi:hypothetical protein
MMEKNLEEPKENQSEPSPEDGTLAQGAPEVADDSIMPMKIASSLGGRGGGHRVAKVMTSANKWFGLAEEQDEIARLEGQPLEPRPEAPQTPPVVKTRVILGRGAWAAILALLFCIPLILWLIWTVFDLNLQLNAIKQTNTALQNQGSEQGSVIALLNAPSIRTYKMTVLDPVPGAEANLHLGGPKLWALSTRQLNSMADKNRVFVLYAVKAGANPGPSDYVALLIFSSGTNASGLWVVDPNKIPNDFGPQKYSKLIISDEPIDQEVKGKPTGLVRFSLDVSQLNLG